MSEKLEELKKQQEKIAEQIKLEEQKKEWGSIQKTDDLTYVEDKAEAKTKLESTLIKQETYKDKVITLEGSKYKINGVVQHFQTIDNAKKYIDAIGAPFDLNRNSVNINKNNNGPAIKFILVLGLCIVVFIIYNAINFGYPHASKEPQSERLEVNEDNCRNITVLHKDLIYGFARELHTRPNLIELGNPVWNYAYRNCNVEVFSENGKFRCYVPSIFKRSDQPMDKIAMGLMVGIDDFSGTMCSR